ncbi:hypothetical protein, partial [Halomonas sp. DP4Y7-1]
MSNYNRETDREFGILESFVKYGKGEIENPVYLIKLIYTYHKANALFFEFFANVEDDCPFKRLYLDLSHRARRLLIEETMRVAKLGFSEDSFYMLHTARMIATDEETESIESLLHTQKVEIL